MNTMHFLTRIRFALVLKKVHFTLDDKFHFCGICIVMQIADFETKMGFGKGTNVYGTLDPQNKLNMWHAQRGKAE